MVTIYRDQEEAISLSPEDRFFFNCHAGLACFNRCCQNPTIILKPYDIIRLRRRLEITSTEFLERYTTQVLEDRSYLPLVLLDIDQEERSGCPFLESSCLTDDGLMDRYFCKRLDFCQGFTKGQEWTLGGWKADQGLEPFNELNREWIEIILKKSALNTVAAEDTRASAIFSMAAYDIDRFRKFIFETPFLEIFEIPQEVAAALRESDRELLRFGYKYVKLVLLLEDAAKMKEEMRKLPEPPQGN
jgi:hypothetical protein